MCVSDALAVVWLGSRSAEGRVARVGCCRALCWLDSHPPLIDDLPSEARERRRGLWKAAWLSVQSVCGGCC